MKYSDKEWQELFNQVDKSELPGKQWCLQNNISYGSYKYHRYVKVKNNDITNVKKSHKLIKVKLADNDIKTNSNGFDIIIGKAGRMYGENSMMPWSWQH